MTLKRYWPASGSHVQLAELDLSERIFRIADGILSAGEIHLAGRVCSAAILLEELEKMSMEQRLKVVTFAQDCIRSLGVEAAGGIEMLMIEEGHLDPAPMRISYSRLGGSPLSGLTGTQVYLASYKN